MDGPDLSSRTVLVTGSAKGVGRELLLATADCGAKTAVHYHTSADAAREVADEAIARGAEATMTVQADVTDPESVDGLFAAVEAELGTVDVLVNNVGDFAPAHWADLEFTTWNRVLETNLNGTYLCSKRFLQGMREEGGEDGSESGGEDSADGYGRIVNIGYASSEKGMVSPKNFPYFVAKAGVLMFTRMLAADTQDDEITVNAISPYVVENSDEFPDALPRGRPANFEDLIQPLYFFLDPDSAYVSGENVEVDGGWLPEDV